jgi:hypothetical protein
MNEALDAVKTDLGNIIPVLEKYESFLDTVKADLNVKNKAIDRANIEQTSLLYQYNERHIELRAVLKYLDDVVASTRGRLWVKLTEDSHKALQQKDKEHYINCEPDFLAMKELYNEVEELVDKYAAVVDAFRTRGYVLNNLTHLIRADAQDHILD